MKLSNRKIELLANEVLMNLRYADNSLVKRNDTAMFNESVGVAEGIVTAVELLYDDETYIKLLDIVRQERRNFLLD